LKRRIIKLGGSLLSWAGSVDGLSAWLSLQTPAQNIVVVGGGPVVEGLRAVDRALKLDESTAHWLCIRAMSINAELVASLVPQSTVIDSVLELLDRDKNPGLLILDPWKFLRIEEPGLPSRPLPMSWQVTSDSIAARVAEVSAAEELVLLKSKLPSGTTSPGTTSPGVATIEEAAGAGFVDPWFALAAEGVPVIRSVNLREAGFPEMRLVRRALAADPSGQIR
jgi:aspartokinase-like uncharacterized kinase